jgi:hypothetical protein
MPQIIVTAGDATDLTDGKVTLRERINASDFDSDRFATNLVERLGWAVGDAAEVEAVSDAPAPEAEEDSAFDDGEAQPTKAPWELVNA